MPPPFTITLKELNMVDYSGMFKNWPSHSLEKFSRFHIFGHCSNHLRCSLASINFQNTLVHLSDDLYFLTVIQHTASSTILNSRTSFMDICVMCWQVLMLNDDVCQKSKNSESLIFMTMYDALRTYHKVGKFSPLHYYVVCFCIFLFCFPLSQWSISCAICLQYQHGISSYCSLFPHWLSDPRVTLYLKTTYETWEIHVYDISAKGFPPVAVVSKLVQK